MVGTKLVLPWQKVTVNRLCLRNEPHVIKMRRQKLEGYRIVQGHRPRRLFVAGGAPVLWKSALFGLLQVGHLTAETPRTGGRLALVRYPPHALIYSWAGAPPATPEGHRLLSQH